MDLISKANLFYFILYLVHMKFFLAGASFFSPAQIPCTFSIAITFPLGSNTSCRARAASCSTSMNMSGPERHSRSRPCNGQTKSEGEIFCEGESTAFRRAPHPECTTWCRLHIESFVAGISTYPVARRLAPLIFRRAFCSSLPP